MDNSTIVKNRSVSMAAGITVAVVAMVGCGGTGEVPGSGGPSEDNVQTSAALTARPVPVASLALPNGNTLEFYDFGRGALVSEVGEAYTAPAFIPKDEGADQLTTIWQTLAPDTPVPAKLASLQDRLTNLPPDSAAAATDRADGGQGGTPMPGSSGVISNAPVGCNNGCCDYQWLSTFGQCQGGGDYSWFLYNYGWSYANATSVGYYTGFVCSAQGTSTYRVSLGSSGGTWSVPEAHYRTYWWLAGTVCNPFCHYAKKTLSSSVNSSASPHLHTYCGWLYH